MPRPTLLALALLGFAGCALGDGVIGNVQVSPAYRMNEFNYAAAGRDLRTEVIGNPFGLPQADFGRAVTDAMQGAHFGSPTNFTTRPADSARSLYRVRMVFNGPAALNGWIVCSGEPASLPPSVENGDVRLLAAFCRGRQPLTYLVGSASDVSGPGDPRFIGFIRQATLSLFPAQNTEENNDKCTPPDC